MFCKDDLFKKDCTRKQSFLYYLENGIFSPKNIFFPWVENERWSISRNTQKYEIVFVDVGVLQSWRHAPLPKKSEVILSQKIHLKVIDVLDWHSRKSPSNSLYFHGDLYGRFDILLSSEKNRKLNKQALS